MSEIVFTSKWKRHAGRPVYIVPVVRDERGFGPRCPISGWSAYYNADKTQAAIVVSEKAAAYLDKRSYARRIGLVVFGLSNDLERKLKEMGYGR